MGQMKKSITVTALCKGLSPVVATFVNYSRGLSFTEAPDYKFMRNLFRDKLLFMGQTRGTFDWGPPLKLSLPGVYPDASDGRGRKSVMSIAHRFRAGSPGAVRHM